MFDLTISMGGLAAACVVVVPLTFYGLYISLVPEDMRRKWRADRLYERNQRRTRRIAQRYARRSGIL